MKREMGRHGKTHGDGQLNIYNNVFGQSNRVLLSNARLGDIHTLSINVYS